MPDAIFPVCSPSLLAHRASIERPEDLLDHVLLHDTAAEAGDSGCAWRDWFKSVGLAIERPDGPRFSQEHLALEAAAGGLGVALGRATLVHDELVARRLVRPLSHAIPTAFSHYLVHKAEADSSRHLAAFVEWLNEEAAARLSREQHAV